MSYMSHVEGAGQIRSEIARMKLDGPRTLLRGICHPAVWRELAGLFPESVWGDYAVVVDGCMFITEEREEHAHSGILYVVLGECTRCGLEEASCGSLCSDCAIELTIAASSCRECCWWLVRSDTQHRPGCPLAGTDDCLPRTKAEVSAVAYRRAKPERWQS